MLFSSAFALTPEDILKQADTLREKGQSLQAISLYNEALVSLQKKNDYNGMLSALNGRLISWKHLFYETKEPLYILLVKQHAEAMKFLADEHGLTKRLPVVHFQLGMAYTLNKEYSQAEIELSKALNLFPEDNAEKGDWMAHLGYAMYLNGKKAEGKAKILEGIQQIKTRSTDPFKRAVWLSGAKLRLAELLEKDDPRASYSYFQKAKAIIEDNPALVIRSKQLAQWQAKHAPH